LRFKFREGERVPPRAQQIAPRDLHLKDVKLPLPLDLFARLCVRREGAPNGSRGGCGPHQNLQPNATVKKRRGSAEESGTTEGLIPVNSAFFAIFAVQIPGRGARPASDAADCASRSAFEGREASIAARFVSAPVCSVRGRTERQPGRLRSPSGAGWKIGDRIESNPRLP